MKLHPVAVIGSVIVLAYLGEYVKVSFFGPSDTVLIKQAVKESVDASKEGRPGGVLDYLSANFKVNQQSPGSRYDIANFIKNSRPDITIGEVNPAIAGNEARVTTPVRVQLEYGPIHFDKTLKDVTLVFHREDDHAWAIIPVKNWKLSDVLVAPGSLPVSLGQD